MPTQDDMLGYFSTLSNWGRWGDDDELGTLYHITDDVRLAVRHGRSVSCAWDVAVTEDVERSTTSRPYAPTCRVPRTCRRSDSATREHPPSTQTRHHRLCVSLVDALTESQGVRNRRAAIQVPDTAGRRRPHAL
jgi:hypothetical protein